MKINRALIIVMVVAAAAGLLACRPDFKQVVLSPEEIPVAMRETVGDDRLDIRNVVWHAYYEQGGYEIAVLSSFQGDAREIISHQRWRWLVFRDGEPFTPPGFSQPVAFGIGANYMSYTHPEPFNWQPSEQLSLDHLIGINSASIWAVGYAWVDDAHRVVGTTFAGRTFEASVINGYWILLDLDVKGADRADRFETVDVLDKQGNVIHTYTRTG